VTRDEDVEAMLDFAVRDLGRLDLVVNNAGGYSEPCFPDASVEHWTTALDLNLRSVMAATHFAIRVMRHRGGGAVVNIASSAALGIDVHASPEYAAAKAAVVRFTTTLADLASVGIRVNCVCPHTVATKAVKRRVRALQSGGAELPPDLRGELLTPNEVADAVIEVATDDACAGRVVLLHGGRAPAFLSPGPS
jgi:NAD(P)-dependent dehydrogenase (short-subunit alcohol dehydrogenase family)